MFWTRAGVYEHLFSILEGLDVISNILKEREVGRERERERRKRTPRSGVFLILYFVLFYSIYKYR